MQKTRVRFHLGKGEHFMMWQIRYANSDIVRYVDPMEHRLLLTNGKLVNKQKTAKKIHDGAHKSVCAWIECDDAAPVKAYLPTEKATPVWFNPRKYVNWVDSDGNNLDGKEFLMAFTVGRNVYIEWEV